MKQIHITFDSKEAEEKLLADKEFVSAMTNLINLASNISSRVGAEVSLGGTEVFKIYECEMCGEILDHVGRFCSEECANENAYMYRTCQTCGGEFWDGGTSCTCDDDYTEVNENDIEQKG